MRASDTDRVYGEIGANYAEKSSVELGPGFNVGKLFSSSLTPEQNKLECFTLVSFSR